MKKFSPVLIALLGIIVGALAVTTYNTYRQKKHYYNVQYGDWRKLNLILDQVDKNYVDTVNNEEVTEAAIVAALAALASLVPYYGVLYLLRDRLQRRFSFRIKE